MSLHSGIYYLIILLLLSFNGLCEGTKELRPQEDNLGSLHITRKVQFTQFAQYGAPDAMKIKIRISSEDEKIYYGLNNKTEAGDFREDVPYRIVSPSGEIVVSSFIPSSGEGFINTWSEAVAGPQELGNAAGYDALEIFPEETGDYVIEFDISNITDVEEIQIHLFDITVAGPDNIAIPGRLHSKGWQLSTEYHANPFHGKVYPYGPNGAVYEVDFNQMEPFTFFINFNSSGTANTGNTEEDRKSRIGNHSFPEYEVFLNPPDQQIFPTGMDGTTYSIAAEKTGCLSNEYCFKISASSKGVFEGYMDINANGIYDADSLDLLFYEEFEAGEEKCVAWNGKDAKGNPVDTNQLHLFSTFGFGVTHLPLYDVEQNRNGFKVRLVRPASAPDPLLYWDDSNITDGSTLGDALVNLTGCSSSTSGCHRWENRGDVGKNNPEIQETINTWWFNTTVYDTLIFNASANSKASISYERNSLLITDTSLCSGDSLIVFVLNDGNSHFDTEHFLYQWQIATETIAENEQELKVAASSEGPLVLAVTDLNYTNCVTFDTLQAEVFAPYEISLLITDEDCRTQTGSIEVQINTGAPSPRFQWQDFPEHNSPFLSNLGPGSYNLIIQASDHSANCSLDTNLLIRWPMETRIDSFRVTASECYTSSGEVFLYLKDPAESYEFTWNGTLTGTESSLTGLAAGEHTVQVRNIDSDCIADTNFNVSALPLEIAFTKEDEVCGNRDGLIELSLPEADFTINWGSESGTDARYFLSAGSYPVSVSFSNSCVWDSTITINNLSKMPPMEAFIVTPSDCDLANGTAEISVNESVADYVFSWNGAAFGQAEKVENLKPGEHHLAVRISGGNCSGDTIFFVPGKGFSFTVHIIGDSCSGNTGATDILVTNPDISISWWDGDTTFNRSSLSSGEYTFSLSNAENSSCSIDTFVVIPELDVPLNPDFTVSSSSFDERFYPGQSIAFSTNSTAEIDSCAWNFGDGSVSFSLNPEHIYSEEKNYVVTFFVRDKNGCTGTVSENLKVGMFCDATLPSAFSPNGDGKNDNIGVLGKAENPTLMIFNRWGQLIFRSDDDEKRWNGNYQNQPVPVGIYPYVLEYDCKQETGEEFRKQVVGEITVIR